MIWYVVKDYALSTLFVKQNKATLKIFSTVLERYFGYIFSLASHTGQMASMEHWLNSLNNINYDLPSRTALIASSTIIYIEDGDPIVQNYIYDDTESQPPIFIFDDAEGEPPVYLFDNNEFVGNTYKIMVPAASLLNLDMIRAQAELLRIAGKTFTVNYY